MNVDMKQKRASFIDKSTSVREMFEFAHPVQVISAVEKYCCDHYGSMLWPLYGEGAGKYYRCWNTLAKLCWDVPRGTHTKFVSSVLARDRVSVRVQILSRYIKFVRSLLRSESPEVRSVANKLVRDRGSTTGINIARLREETRLNTWTASPAKVRHVLLEAEQVVPDNEQWSIPLLQKLLEERQVMESDLSNTDNIDDLISSLCTS